MNLNGKLKQLKFCTVCAIILSERTRIMAVVMLYIEFFSDSIPTASDSLELNCEVTCKVVQNA